MGDLGFWEKPRQNRPKPQKCGLRPLLFAFFRTVLLETMLSHNLGFWERLPLHLGEPDILPAKTASALSRSRRCSPSRHLSHFFYFFFCGVFPAFSIWDSGRAIFARKKKPGISPRAMSCYLKWYVIIACKCALFVYIFLYVGRCLFKAWFWFWLLLVSFFFFLIRFHYRHF